jgi:hypothetical protein
MSTTTVSVRDGWLISNTHGWVEYSDGLGAVQIRYIVCMDEDSERNCAELHLEGVDEPMFVPGVHAAEVMELIHAGKGEIRREVP